MPYIVTTTREVRGDVVSGDPVVTIIVSRVAVATLDEARDAVGVELNEEPHVSMDTAEFDRAMAQVDALTDEGGTVGPLPRGFTITVERSS